MNFLKINRIHTFFPILSRFFLLIFLFSGCVRQGSVTSYYFPENETTLKYIYLGTLSSNGSLLSRYSGFDFSNAFVISGDFIKGSAKSSPNEYLFRFLIESTAFSLPSKVSKDNLVVFLINGKTFNFTIKEVQASQKTDYNGSMTTGTATESFLCGPLPTELLEEIKSAEEISFKIFGCQGEIKVTISQSQISLIKENL